MAAFQRKFGGEQRRYSSYRTFDKYQQNRNHENKQQKYKKHYAKWPNKLNRVRAAFGRLHSVWRYSQIFRRTKLGIFNACLYITQIWLIPNTITHNNFRY